MTVRPPVVMRVDTVLVAPARLRDTRDVKALEDDGHAVVRHQKDRGNIKRWKDDDGGLHYRARLRRRPGVRVGNRKWRSPLHVHQPDEAALEFIRSALAHGRLVVLRLDVAWDIACASLAAADALHDELRHGGILLGSRGAVRVSHATAATLGTTYMGVAKGEEGAVLTIYSDHRAGKKNGGVPSCHLELRLFGSRVVRGAVGRALEIARAWDRVRVVESLSRAPTLVRRAAQNAGPFPYAQDVADVMRRHGLDRRPVFASAVPVGAWMARRNPAGPSDSHTVAAEVGRTDPIHALPHVVESPTRAMTRHPLVSPRAHADAPHAVSAAVVPTPHGHQPASEFDR